MKSKQILFFIIIVGILLVVVLAVKKLYLAPSPQKLSNIPSESPKPVQLELEGYTEVLGVTKDEEKEITDFVRSFETLQNEGKAKEVLALFTSPTDNDEKEELDFLEGKDINSSPRLYSTVLLSRKLNWYWVKKIEKQEDKIQVALKELRTLYDNSTGEWWGENENLTLILHKNNGNYKIDKYFHEKPSANVNLKYEGFYE